MWAAGPPMTLLPRARLNRQTGARLARSAWYGSRWRIVIVRRAYFFFERMQRWRLAQARQSWLENLTLMTWLVRLSTAGVQLMPVFPAGQVARSCSQSITNRCASNPVPFFACHLTSG